MTKDRLLVRKAEVSVGPRGTVNIYEQNESVSWKPLTSMVVADSIAAHKAKSWWWFHLVVGVAR